MFNQLLILHADHEQNCSTSTVRIVGSSHAGLFASISPEFLRWGRLHGGANQAVLEMLDAIMEDGGDTKKFMQKAKDNHFVLWALGTESTKTSTQGSLIKKAADEVLNDLGM